MKWKNKARLQKAIAYLPNTISYRVYYWTQRRLGGLRKISPVNRFKAGIEAVRNIQKLGYQYEDKVYFELGTGRVPSTAIAFWLIGAREVITVDLNPYLKDELLRECLQYVCDNKREIKELFGELLQEDRFLRLIDVIENKEYNVSDVIDLCNIEYLAPLDARSTSIGEEEIDYYTSYTVLEHIPYSDLEKILSEGKRIVNSNGLFLHKIDYSDHFSHSDHAISPINFLQYNELEWDRFAGNKYMYMNRMRHDDYIKLFREHSHKILLDEPDIDPSIPRLLEDFNILLDDRFKEKSVDTLSITSSWIVTK